MAKGEQKGEHKEGVDDSQAKTIRLTDIGSVREEAQQINNICVEGQKDKQENKDNKEKDNPVLDNAQLDSMESDVELVNENRISQIDTQEKANQAR
eukprot:9455856-Heterocapsa_arctica.AAC.1